MEPERPARTIPLTAALTAVTLVAFACNSLLCRLALKRSGMDAASFTLIRLASGAAALALIVVARRANRSVTGDWLSAFALFAYAAGFSFAYISLPAGTGALLLFAAVQATMIGHGIAKGERLAPPQIFGLALAFGGLVGLLLPGLAAPDPKGCVLMLTAGVAWGVYSLLGRRAGDATSRTAGNFLRALPMAVLLRLVVGGGAVNASGAEYAIASGALTSGIGYSIWYSVLPRLRATDAATVQLSVPALAAMGSALFLGEPVTLRLTLASIAILSGIAIVIRAKRPSVPV